MHISNLQNSKYMKASDLRSADIEVLFSTGSYRNRDYAAAIAIYRQTGTREICYAIIGGGEK